MKLPVLPFAFLFCACGFAALLWIDWDYQPPPRLPSRPVDELTNWGQGHAPDPNNCPPSTIRFDTDDGLFLECYRGTDNESQHP